MLSFVHVGLHKTGTTWLQDLVFPSHPQLNVFTPNHGPSRELIIRHFWASEDEYNRNEAESQFRSLILANQKEDCIMGISDELLTGPFYDDSLTQIIADRILGVFGRTKIILTLRNPIRYINSSYTLYIIRCPGRGLNLRDYVTIRKGFGSGFIRKLNYANLLETYFARFGRENVCVLPYELLVSSPREYLREIQLFLGISEFPENPIISQKSNQSLSVVAVELLRLLKACRVNSIFLRRYLFALDRRGFKKVFSTPRLDYRSLCSCEPAFESVLRSENYQIWEGALSRFNYRF